MSEKEIAMNLLENVPSYKLGYVIAYLQGLTAKLRTMPFASSF